MILIKFGGNAIRGKDDLSRLSREVMEIAENGESIVMVHGGGPEISEEMERRGMKAVKVAGQRITDDDALAVAAEVLRSLNDDVVRALRNAGVNAIGVPGYDVIKSVRKAPITAKDDDGNEITVDLGRVGEVDSVDTDTILGMVDDGKVPVIFPICASSDGLMNVNADTVAAGVAASLKADEMILITDVPGILTDVNDPASKLDAVTFGKIGEMIEDGTISGGMIPKVEGCMNAINIGVTKVRMVNGKGQSILGAGNGTVITR